MRGGVTAALAGVLVFGVTPVPARAQAALDGSYTGSWNVGGAPAAAGIVNPSTIEVQLAGTRLSGRLMLRSQVDDPAGTHLCLLAQIDLNGDELALVDRSADGKTGLDGEVVVAFGGGDSASVNCATVTPSGSPSTARMRVTVNGDATMQGRIDNIQGLEGELAFVASRTTASGATTPTTDAAAGPVDFETRVRALGLDDLANLRARLRAGGTDLDAIARSFDVFRPRFQVLAKTAQTAEVADIIATFVAFEDAKDGSGAPLFPTLRAVRPVYTVLIERVNPAADDPTTAILFADILRRAIELDTRPATTGPSS